jgi:ubiquinone biosynthesis protein
VLGELKGAFAKAGQFAAVRHDLLSAASHRALESLRDRVPPLPFSQIRSAVERELGAPLEELYSRFDPAPLGAASIAQVHRAALPDGTPVAVKVQYPWLAAALPRDLAILRTALQIWQRLRGPSAVKIDSAAVFREFASGMAEEIDFRREARVAAEIAANLAGDEAIVVPRVFPDHSAQRVLTMSFHPTLRLDAQELSNAGVDRGAVLETLARAYAKQVFVDGLFHADPHPGNLFVIDEARALTKPRVLFVDFGLSKRLDPVLRQGMRQAVYALLQRDAGGFVDRMQELGMFTAGARPGVEQAVKSMMARIAKQGGSKGLLGVASGQVLGLKDEAKALLRATPGLQLPNDLLLYAKTLSYLFALGDELAPEVDLLKLSTPYLLRFLAER